MGSAGRVRVPRVDNDAVTSVAIGLSAFRLYNVVGSAARQ